MPEQRLPTYYLSHGGGPWPWMKNMTGQLFDRLEASLVAIPDALPISPRAVLVISGHWEAPEFTVSNASRPPMVYDYGGFPDEFYRIRYDAPGAPDVAEQVSALLNRAGLPCQLDSHRGLDHGTFSIMQPMHPEADMPVLQLSIAAGYDPGLHYEAGRALAPLREEGVLILGSGSSYHNLRLWSPAGAPISLGFDAWLQETLTACPPSERRKRLEEWTSAPFARAAHPREDHLVPLMVAVGAADNADGTLVYHEDNFMGCIALSSWRFD